jgi:hypothetical protein
MGADQSRNLEKMNSRDSSLTNDRGRSENHQDVTVASPLRAGSPRSRIVYTRTALGVLLAETSLLDHAEKVFQTHFNFGQPTSM